MEAQTQAPVKKSAKFKRLCEKYGVNPDIVPEVLSVEEACKVTGDKLSPIRITGAPERHVKRMIADCHLSIIAEALRNMEQVNYTNTSPKYHAVFEVKADSKRPSGFGLSSYGYDYWDSHSDVGVRLCFHNRDTAIFFGKHFLNLHTDHHLYT